MRRISGLILIVASCCLPEPAVAQNGDHPPMMLGVRFADNTSVFSYIKPNGPADRAGLQIGDELYSIDEHYILQSGDMVRALEGKLPGDRVMVEVRRNGQYRLFSIPVMRRTRHDEQIAVDGRIIPPPPEFGMVSQTLPDLQVTQWHGMAGDSSAPAANWRGKAVVLLVFRSSCQYSLLDGLPKLREIQEHFAGDPELAIVAAQSTSGEDAQDNLENAVQLFQQHHLRVPIGQEEPPREGTLSLLKRLRAPGTPWIMLIDRDGIVQHNGIPETVTNMKMIEQLISGELQSPTAPPEFPEMTAAGPGDAASDANTDQ